MNALATILAVALANITPAKLTEQSHVHAVFDAPGVQSCTAVYLRPNWLQLSMWVDEPPPRSVRIYVDGKPLGWSKVEQGPWDRASAQLTVLGDLIVAAESELVVSGKRLRLRFTGDELEQLKFLYQYQRSLDPWEEGE